MGVDARRDDRAELGRASRLVTTSAIVIARHLTMQNSRLRRDSRAPVKFRPLAGQTRRSVIDRRSKPCAVVVV